MTLTQRRRQKALLPDDIPRWIRVYDNGDGGEQYTVIFTGRYRHKTGGEFCLLGMSDSPYWPLGICLHSSYPFQVDCRKHVAGQPPKYCWPPAIGRKCHLGRRIPFADLPPDCQHVTMNDYCELWDLQNPKPKRSDFEEKPNGQ